MEPFHCENKGDLFMTGLRKKPLWIKLLSLFLWINAIGMPLQVMVIFGHPPTEFTAIWAKLTLQNKVVMAMSPVAAYGLQRVTRWGWFAIMSFITVALFNNIILLQFPTPIPKYMVFLATLVLAGAGSWFLRPSVVSFFQNVHVHWWKPAPRYSSSLPVELEIGDDGRLTSTAYNISKTGIFVATPKISMKTGDIVNVKIGFERKIIRGLASVVRYGKGSSSYPEGFGLRFLKLTIADRIWLHLKLAGVVAT
jgi:hypothetical protein